jgi:protein-disulfide isomerase
MERKQQQQLWIVGGAIAIALVVAVAVILMSNSPSAARTDVDFDDLNQTRLSDGGFVLGDPDAPITIVEFADFLCPHCQDYKDTVNRVIEDFVVTGQARFEFRMIVTQGPTAEFLFRIAECVAETDGGDFWDAHEEIFALAADSSVDRNDIAREAVNNMGLSYAEVFQCAEEMREEREGQYLTDGRLGSGVDVQGTPAVRVRFGDMEAPVELLGAARGSLRYEAIQAAVIEANS